MHDVRVRPADFSRKYLVNHLIIGISLAGNSEGKDVQNGHIEDRSEQTDDDSQSKL